MSAVHPFRSALGVLPFALPAPAQQPTPAPAPVPAVRASTPDFVAIAKIVLPCVVTVRTFVRDPVAEGGLVRSARWV